MYLYILLLYYGVGTLVVWSVVRDLDVKITQEDIIKEGSDLIMHVSTLEK